jgi:hypothetical protein
MGDHLFQSIKPTRIDCNDCLPLHFWFRAVTARKSGQNLVLSVLRIRHSKMDRSSSLTLDQSKRAKGPLHITYIPSTIFHPSWISKPW